jgi:hypothetical protein
MNHKNIDYRVILIVLIVLSLTLYFFKGCVFNQNSNNQENRPNTGNINFK